MECACPQFFTITSSRSWAMTRQRTGLRCWSSSLSDSFRPKKEDPHRSGGGLPFCSLADRGRTSRRVSRILSCDTEVPSGDHPSGHTVAGYLEQSTRRLGRAALEHLRSRTRGPGGHRCGLRPCSGRGLPSRPGHPGRWCALTAPFHPHRRLSVGGLFSVALSRESPRVAVSNRPALWSPDFPRPRA